MAAEEDFVLSFTGEETDNLLKHTQGMKNQTSAEDGDTVQVYDVNGIPHKVAKTELLKKSTLALPSLSDISAFVAVNQAGNAIGIMSKEQVAEVLGELIDINSYLKTTNTMLRPDNDMNNVGYGIYTFAPESGYPQNFPSTGGRGIVVVFKTYPHLLQVVYALQNNSAKMFVRLSYNEGANWYDWKEISFTQ